MAALTITRENAAEISGKLASFPHFVTEILRTLDDPDANLKILVEHIQRDPVISARVLSRANAAGSRTRGSAAIQNIYTATSLIGMRNVREMTVISSLASFVDSIAPPGLPVTFWQHNVAAGVCSVEMALHMTAPVSIDAALIAGLLHDIGQLWLYRMDPAGCHAAWAEANTSNSGIDIVEREHFGVDHATIGGWLAEHWSLPANITAAIAHHHAPDEALHEPLVPLVYIAEVLSNALDLTGRDENRVTTLSAPACKALGLVWNAELRPLFGRMEARSRHANAMFQ